MEIIEAPKDLSSLAAQAKEQEQTTGGQFMSPGTKKKGGARPGAGRKPKDSTGGAQGASQAQPNQPPLPPPIPTKDIVRPVIEIMSSWTSRMIKDDRAKMNEEEKEAIVTSGAMVLDKWAPYMMGAFGPEIMFISVLSMWGTRVYAIHTVNESEKRKREREQPYAGNGKSNGVAEEHRDFGGAGEPRREPVPFSVPHN